MEAIPAFDWCRDPDGVERVVSSRKSLEGLAGGIAPREAQVAVTAVAHLLDAILAKEGFDNHIIQLLIAASSLGVESEAVFREGAL